MTCRGFAYALHPTSSQARALIGWIGAARLVYNLAVEQRRDFWRQFYRATGQRISWASQSRELTVLRQEHEWFAEVPRSGLEQALRDADRAYTNFFAGRAGYPTTRAKFRNDTIRLQIRGNRLRALNAKWGAIKLPNIGWVKFRCTRAVSGRPLSATVRLSGGRWSVAIAAEMEEVVATPAPAMVGIDRGVARTLTLSTGESIHAPGTAALLARQKRAQRTLARRRKGSGRRRIAKARVAALSARAARVRTDWAHRSSTDIARRFGLVAIEALDVQNMTASAAGTIAEPGRSVRQKAGLNRSILEQSWGKFAQLLDYKLTERGGVLISVPAAYSSQTCASCGVVDVRSRESQAVFRCVHCDHTDNADVNAAKEILRRSTALLGAEGLRWQPDEAPIMAAA